MLKFHLFPWNTGIDAVLGPLKLPLGLKLRSEALGQFWRPMDGNFSSPSEKGGILAHIIPILLYSICHEFSTMVSMRVSDRDLNACFPSYYAG